MSSMFGPNKYARSGLEDTGWLTLTLQNNWVDYGAPFGSASYRRIGGIVYLAGLIKNGTTTNGTVLANLPAGFRPAYQTLYTMPTNVTPPVVRVDIFVNGNIALGGTAGSWFSLNCPPFPADL